MTYYEFFRIPIAGIQPFLYAPCVEKTKKPDRLKRMITIIMSVYIPLMVLSLGIFFVDEYIQSRAEGFVFSDKEKGHLSCPLRVDDTSGPSRWRN